MPAHNRPVPLPLGENLSVQPLLFVRVFGVVINGEGLPSNHDAEQRGNCPSNDIVGNAALAQVHVGSVVPSERGPKDESSECKETNEFWMFTVHQLDPREDRVQLGLDQAQGGFELGLHDGLLEVPLEVAIFYIRCIIET